MEPTFNDIPLVLSQLQEKLNHIENLLLTRIKEQKNPLTDEVLTVAEAATFLSLSVPTIYGLISRNEIPVMKRSKRCYFSKSDLLNYLKAGRKATISELAEEADKFLQASNQRKKKGAK